jgi:hypothetical protein
MKMKTDTRASGQERTSTAQGFCGMAHSSARKKSNNDDSDSDSEDEVNNDPSFLVAENVE